MCDRILLTVVIFQLSATHVTTLEDQCGYLPLDTCAYHLHSTKLDDLGWTWKEIENKL